MPPSIMRKPIVTILGHVDHGKTTLLDTIRRTTVTERESGAITQAIGASIIPAETITRLCGSLLKQLKVALTIPGLLFIDTPGHAAFSNLRKRGGNLADIAILVVDINEGFKPQTFEAIEILKVSKTPFIIAANKIDLINGWKVNDEPLLMNITKQIPATLGLFETRLYELVGKFYELGFQAERFDRVTDITKQLSLIPISAKTGLGLPELLMVLTGLTQKYLNESLRYELDGPAKGSILEVKEDKGLGKTIDVIIYDGQIKVKDTLIIGGIGKPIITKVKALFEPVPLHEMRDAKSKFASVKTAFAATGIKIAAPELDGVVAGMPLMVVGDNLQKAVEEIQSQVEEVIIETDKEGIIIKADSLGSLEAMISLLKEKNLIVRKATIGDITKKDIIEAEAVIAKNPLKGVILGFNVVIASDVADYASRSAVKIITHEVIYSLLEQFEKWLDMQKKLGEQKNLDGLMYPAKLEFLRNHTFRQSHPAIIGVDLLAGKIKIGTALMKNTPGHIGVIKSIKIEQENVSETTAPKQLPISIDGPTVGRQIQEGDILYTAIPEGHFKKLKEMKHLLKKEEIEVLKEIAEIMRKDNPVWGV
ncbi:translation initiation factor IF-2 [Candidatus Woesearchaeota archaeon]|nr:translation initiation factor IF-2 [Candidatus Woesearchaeota archaeon]